MTVVISKKKFSQENKKKISIIKINNKIFLNFTLFMHQIKQLASSNIREDRTHFGLDPGLKSGSSFLKMVKDVIFRGFAAYMAYYINHPLYTEPSTTTQIYSGLISFVLCEWGNFSIHVLLKNLRPAGSTERKIPFVSILIHNNFV